MKRKGFILFLLSLIILFAVIPSDSVFAAKKKYSNWQEVATDMKEVFEEANAAIEKDELKEAYNSMNRAYFQFYETQGFEASVMNYISQSRVKYIEGEFRAIKHILLGNVDFSHGNIEKRISALSLSVYKDAMILDGVAKADDPDEIALEAWGGVVEIEVDLGSKKWQDFLSSFVLLLREGLEAILVVVAIIAYLIKTGNKHLCKDVYIGCLYGILLSIVLAFSLIFFLKSDYAGGLVREYIEGVTMLIAVAVLFYVSNWLLSKSDAEKWDQYIQDQVQKSIDTRSKRTLVFAAFLAVFREGAELILFYSSMLSGGRANIPYSIAGMLAATVVLAVVFVIYRYTSVKLPLKPFFMVTSIFLFMMCITFMGKGISELSNAGFISGSTSIPLMNGFSIPDLGIYDRAEILFPQLLLVVAAVWILLSHRTPKQKELSPSVNEDPSV